MKISDLVKLRNNLQSISFTALNHEVNNIDAAVSKNINLPLHENYKASVNTVINFISQFESQIENQQQYISAFIKDIEQEIAELAAPMMQLGYEINGFYGSNLTNWDVERSDRVLELSDDERGEIGTVVRSYTNWQYPTLEIGPGDGDWTESLVAGDPLYIVDRHQEFLNSTLSKFNPVYQRRVRPYLTGLHADRPEFDYSMLPKGQFSFIFAWNVVNFWPFQETKHTIRQCWDLLRPGGAMMFSFNNCDVVQCAEAAESGYKSYLTPKLLNTVFDELGFKVIQYRSTSSNIHWVEVKKPGILATSKRHQALGKIVSFVPVQEVDTDNNIVYTTQVQEKVYTAEEIEQLKKEAIALNINSKSAINLVLSPAKLEYLINLKRKNQ